MYSEENILPALLPATTAHIVYCTQIIANPNFLKSLQQMYMQHINKMQHISSNKYMQHIHLTNTLSFDIYAPNLHN